MADVKYPDYTPVDEPVRRGIRVEGKPVKASRKFHGLDDDPDKYSSVRSEGFSKDLDRLKNMSKERTKDAAISIAKGAAKSSVLPGVGQAMAGEDFSKGARELEMGQRIRDTEKSMRNSADREMADQIRRESRGVKETQENLGSAMKKGGMTASSRADGCCVKGKTRGKMM